MYSLVEANQCPFQQTMWDQQFELVDSTVLVPCTVKSIESCSECVTTLQLRQLTLCWSLWSDEIGRHSFISESEHTGNGGT